MVNQTSMCYVFSVPTPTKTPSHSVGLLHYENMGPHNCGVPHQRVSGYHKFEGLDPAEWSERGYATVGIDSRGIGDSEGDAVFWGQQVSYLSS